MSTHKLTIVPVSLDPLPTEVSTSVPAPSCIIKTTFGEISLFNGADEYIIHTIFKELKEL